MLLDYLKKPVKHKSVDSDILDFDEKKMSISERNWILCERWAKGPPASMDISYWHYAKALGDQNPFQRYVDKLHKNVVPQKCGERFFPEKNSENLVL